MNQPKRADENRDSYTYWKNEFMKLCRPREEPFSEMSLRRLYRPLATGGAGGIDFHFTESNGLACGGLEAGTATGACGSLNLAMYDLM